VVVTNANVQNHSLLYDAGSAAAAAVDFFQLNRKSFETGDDDRHVVTPSHWWNYIASYLLHAVT